MVVYRDRPSRVQLDVELQGHLEVGWLSKEDLLIRIIVLATLLIIVAIIAYFPNVNSIEYVNSEKTNEIVRFFWNDIVNSSFVIAAVGSLAGAFFGAFGAQWIADNNKAKDGLISEIRDTNAAILLSFSACDRFLGFKRLLFIEMKRTFDSHKEEFNNHLNQLKIGVLQGNKSFNLHADFRSLPPLTPPLDILEKRIFECISVNGRELMLATTLRQTTISLNRSIEKRNSLIENFKISKMEPNEMAYRYFGIAFPSGALDREYSDTMSAISEDIDNGIFFSMKLCGDLVSHGQNIKTKLDNRFRNIAMNISRPDFSKAEKEGLIPGAENFRDWEAAFKKKQ